MVMSATFEERFKTMHRLEGELEQIIGELELERIKWPKAASLAPLPCTWHLRSFLSPCIGVSFLCRALPGRLNVLDALISMNLIRLSAWP